MIKRISVKQSALILTLSDCRDFLSSTCIYFLFFSNFPLYVSFHHPVNEFSLSVFQTDIKANYLVCLYSKVGSAEEHEVEVTGTSYDLQGLNEFTEYSVWLVAVNANGAGDATHEVTAKTFSDVPSREPQNVTVEAASSRVSWNFYFNK